MKIRELARHWEHNAKGRLTHNNIQIRLDLESAARLAALSEMYPKRQPQELLGELIGAALEELEAIIKSGNPWVKWVPNDRAITVKVNEVVGVAGFLAPGSHVDLLVNIKDDRDTAISRVVLERIMVLAVAQEARRPEETKARVVNAVTLEVTPEQAEKIDLARNVGGEAVEVSALV